MNSDPVLSVAQAAEYLGLSTATLRRLKDQGRIAHHTVGTKGGKILFRQSDLENYLASCRKQPGIEVRKRERDRVADLLGIVHMRDYLPASLRP